MVPGLDALCAVRTAATNTMIEFIFTLDYEIYGNGVGSLRELVYEPMEILRSVFKKWNVPCVVFVEAAELEVIEAQGSDPYSLRVREQVRDLGGKASRSAFTFTRSGMGPYGETMGGTSTRASTISARCREAGSQSWSRAQSRTCSRLWVMPTSDRSLFARGTGCSSQRIPRVQSWRKMASVWTLRYSREACRDDLAWTIARRGGMGPTGGSAAM